MSERIGVREKVREKEGSGRWEEHEEESSSS